jgi:hypothetical protein
MRIARSKKLRAETSDRGELTPLSESGGPVRFGDSSAVEVATVLTG